MEVDPVSGEQFLGYVIMFFKTYFLIVVPLVILGMLGFFTLVFCFIRRKTHKMREMMSSSMSEIGKFK